MSESDPEQTGADSVAASSTEPASETPAKKAPAKKAPAKKATAKKSTKKAAAKRTAKKAAKSSGAPPKYPRHSVERALRIPRAIYDQNAGNPATPKEAAIFTGATGVSGNFNVEISSAKKYGYLETKDSKLVVTERARQAIAPQAENDRLHAFRDAILAAPELSDVYNYYRGENLPDQQFLVNALTDRFKIPHDKVTEFLEVFNESLKSAELIDDSGERPRLYDVGRDEGDPGSGERRSVPKAHVPAGATCFVMQPFSAPLGSYYESVFKPAAQQAGLTAVRADADIFGTGKVIDQIWRGIQEAQVLVAELTTKNANVLYELGLAHALQKPVVLVSSNLDDVPFDLQHIRVIVYDQADPFWGQKLIDKVADNIRSAINNPEEAIFRIDRLEP